MPSRDSGASGILIARRSFSTYLRKQLVVVQQGTLVEKGDPIVRGREQMFEPVEGRIRSYRARPVEQATAAPGEQRATQIPEPEEASAS